MRNCVFTIKNINNNAVKVFVQGQSPSERRKTIKELIEHYYKNKNLPNNIIVAEQINGEKAGNTVDFLIQNKYKIVFFVIQNPPQFNHTHWNYRTNDNISISDLDKRAEDVRSVF